MGDVKTYTVYVHTCIPSGKSYVGYTSHGMERRWKEHCTDALRYKLKRLLHQAIRKYGTDAWEHRVLSVHSTEDEAEAAEIRCIAELNTMMPNGYNMTLGGEGTTGYKLTEEHKQILVKENKKRSGKKHPGYGKKRSAETKRKMSEARTLSNLNRVWVTNGTMNRFVTRDEAKEILSDEQWRAGRSLSCRSRHQKA